MFFIKNFFNNYNTFKENDIKESKIFVHNDLINIINKYKKIYYVKSIGLSVEKRKIFKIKIGRGNLKVFIWSQMHGNETTGTKSMFDILNFFLKNKKSKISDFILKKLTIVFIPMLNPDGSSFFKRRNSLEIDLNRDIIKTQSPEIKILTKEVEKEKPNILFNLHDQKSVYNVGYEEFNPAILSFLSPSIHNNKKYNMNLCRIKSMGLIYDIFLEIKKILPKIGSIGRYSSEYYPTASGDYFQKIGYPCILIEAGNYPKDYHKKIVRKYNTMAILIGFYILSIKNNIEKNSNFYYSIKENKKILLDKIFRRVKAKRKNVTYVIDIGMNIIEKYDFYKKDIRYFMKIVDIGDLSNMFSYENIIASEKKFIGKNGRTYPKVGDYEIFNVK